jgi:hypothetical protein
MSVYPRNQRISNKTNRYTYYPGCCCEPYADEIDWDTARVQERNRRQNCRMKDFYDVKFLSLRFEFDGQTPVEAIRATFNRRETRLPDVVPVAFTQEFATDKAPQWNAFIQRNRLPAELIPSVVDAIRVFFILLFAGQILSARLHMENQSRQPTS